jgi:CRP-like cAMP-binding protein
LFTDLGASARKMLAEAAVQRVYRTGATVVDRGTSWPYFGLVTSGSVTSMVSTDAGRDYCLYVAFPADVFGEIQALDTGVTIARYDAGAPKTTILFLPRSLVLDLADNDGKFARRLAAVCAQRARLLHEMLYARVAKSTITRLAAVILPYAERTEGFAKSLQPLLSMTQRQLACAAGTVKDVVGRDLAALHAGGAVELCNGRVVRVNEARLRDFL